jgi:hypothetical protein
VSTLGLREIADPLLLKALWKRPVRKRLRALRFPDFVLAHDALEWAWVDYQLEEIARRILPHLESGLYRPDPVETVRAAKSVGLTRPLSYLSTPDALLYRSIVQRSEASLLGGFPKWARFGRGDDEDEGANIAESGWFRAWLARQKHHWVMSGEYEWLVETDIANFFPYVDIGAIVQHVLARANLSEDAARLLDHMLRAFSPMASYRPSQIGGLPQEPLDASRILAHAYLRPVDEAFAQEGSEERYTRWMDDIVIGARTRSEALQQVRRTQEALERLGLYPNTAKTRILDTREFEREYMKDENDYVGEVEAGIKSGSAIDIGRFHKNLHRHLLIRRRTKIWGRLLRRYYSASRALGDGYLLNWWHRHLVEAPDSSHHILEYLSVFRLTEARLSTLAAVLSELGRVYQDVELLAREYVAVAPNQNNRSVIDRICQWALDTIDESLERDPRLAAAAAVNVGKFGDQTVIDELERIYRSRMDADSVCRQQTVSILFAHGRLGLGDLLHLGAGSSPTSVSQLQYLQALIVGTSGQRARRCSWHNR